MKANTHKLAAGLLAVLTAAGPASAALTGNVSANSEYVFRGISSSGGAAVQGGLEYAHETGLYAGFWGSNVSPVLSDQNELDLYAGYAPTLNDFVSLDFGALYYVFSEDEQGGGDTDTDYLEVYAGVTIQNLSLYLWYADNFLNVEDNTGVFPGSGTDDGQSLYISADYSLPLRDNLSLGLHVGSQLGDGADAVFGSCVPGPDDCDDGEYVDYAVTLNADLGKGWGASFGIAGTDLDEDSAVFGDEDKPKYFVSISKSFTLIE